VVDPDSSRLRVSVTDGAGRALRDGGLAVWLAAIAPAQASGEVAIALVPDVRIRRFNRQYRGKDSATDVLSFPSDGPAKAGRHGGTTGVSGVSRTNALGDIVIATGVARRQAKEAGHSYQTELRVLALHGLLHLLGYDHDRRDDRGRMARVEARLRRRGGLNLGLIARTLGPRSGQARG
jgi:probable rRNA maturation factor